MRAWPSTGEVIEVRNPYGVPLPLVDLGYSLATGGGQPFASGKAEAAGTVPARGARTIQVPVSLDFARMLGLVQGLRPGKVLPYEAALELSVDAPGVGPLSLPLRKSGSLPIPAPPGLAMKDFRWQEAAARTLAVYRSLLPPEALPR